MIQDKRISFNNDLNTIGVGFLFHAIKLNIILAPKNFYVALKLFFTITRNSGTNITSHELIVIVMILENIILRCDEIYFENQIKYYLASSSSISVTSTTHKNTSPFRHSTPRRVLSIPSSSSSSSTPLSPSIPSMSYQDTKEFNAHEYFINEIFTFFKNSINALKTTHNDNKQFLRNLQKFLITLSQLSKYSKVSGLLCEKFKSDKDFIVESVLSSSKISSLIISFYIDVGFDCLDFLQIISEIFFKAEDVRINAVKKICDNTVSKFLLYFFSIFIFSLLFDQRFLFHIHSLHSNFILLYRLLCEMRICCLSFLYISMYVYAILSLFFGFNLMNF